MLIDNLLIPSFMADHWIQFLHLRGGKTERWVQKAELTEEKERQKEKQPKRLHWSFQLALRLRVRTWLRCMFRNTKQYELIREIKSLYSRDLGFDTFKNKATRRLELYSCSGRHRLTKVHIFQTAATCSARKQDQPLVKRYNSTIHSYRHQI